MVRTAKERFCRETACAFKPALRWGILLLRRALDKAGFKEGTIRKFGFSRGSRGKRSPLESAYIGNKDSVLPGRIVSLSQVAFRSVVSLPSFVSHL
jgi:hypothetical protein